ncbi:MAG TPA: preprotein translocase subunit SecE [Candidatus Marinimicrobia bacterium]|nr:preprotein translocase subunit SecE [Candidatus Neomarinimicrobiota bacterium]
MIEKVKNFFNGVQFEMKKVTWPSFEELQGSTGVVIIFSIVLSIFLFIVDFILSKAVQVIL